MTNPNDIDMTEWRDPNGLIQEQRTELGAYLFAALMGQPPTGYRFADTPQPKTPKPK
jgi:hypothetical protein